MKDLWQLGKVSSSIQSAARSKITRLQVILKPIASCHKALAVAKDFRCSFSVLKRQASLEIAGAIIESQKLAGKPSPNRDSVFA